MTRNRLVLGLVLGAAGVGVAGLALVDCGEGPASTLHEVQGRAAVDLPAVRVNKAPS